MYSESGYVFDHNRGLALGPLAGLGTTVSVAFPFVTGATTAASGGIGASVLAAFGGPVGAVIFGVTTAIGLWLKRKKPGQKIATTQIVNEAEPFLVQNLQAWNSSAKTFADQAAASANFDAIWSEVVRACGDPTMGDPGRWCIDDRKPGGKWDWFARYRDPIANDPNVVPNPTLTESILPSGIADMFSGGGGGNLIPLLLGGALLIGGLVYFSNQ